MHKSKSYQKGKDDDKKGCNISVVPGCRKMPSGRKKVSALERWPFSGGLTVLCRDQRKGQHKYEMVSGDCFNGV